tara:strand:- start:2076 stop:2531 length:456 start_codon:yes stop_codon:yes gene_type:complete
MVKNSVRRSSRTLKKTQRWVDDELSGVDLGGNTRKLKEIRNKSITKKDSNKIDYDDFKIKEYMRRLPKIENKKSMNEYNIIDFDNIVNEDIVYETIMIGIPDEQIVEPIILGNPYHEYTVLTIDDYNYLLDENWDELPFNKDILPYMKLEQ